MDCTSDVTIVTAFYILDKAKFSVDTYKPWIENFLLIRTPKVLFSDEHTVNILFQNLPSNIHLVKKEMSEFLVAKYDWKAQYLLDHEAYHSPGLYMIWNEKSNLVKESIDLNPFNSKYFYWADMGGFRDKEKMALYLNWPNVEVCKAIGNRIILANIEKFSYNELIHPFPNFQWVNRIGGGFFGGTKEICLWWWEVYYKTLEYFFEKKRFAGKDQSIMAEIYLRNKDKIHLVEPGWKYGNGWFHLHSYLQGISHDAKEFMKKK